MTEQEYRSVNAVSNSQLSMVENLINGIEQDFDHESLAFGKIFDQIITRQEVDESVHRHKAEKLAEWFYQNIDKQIRNFIDNSFVQYKDFKNLKLEYQGQHFELSAKCMHDFFFNKVKNVKTISIDLKTTDARDRQGFIAACKYFNYDRQAWWYQQISENSLSYIIGVRKSRPHKIFYIDCEKDLQMSTDGKRKATELAFIYWKLFS